MDHLDIAVYINDLEEALNEWDNSLASWHCELEKVQGLIKQLMDDTSKDPFEKSNGSFLFSTFWVAWSIAHLWAKIKQLKLFLCFQENE